MVVVAFAIYALCMTHVGVDSSSDDPPTNGRRKEADGAIV
jgi:hypothetical protein